MRPLLKAVSLLLWTFGLVENNLRRPNRLFRGHKSAMFAVATTTATRWRLIK